MGRTVKETIRDISREHLKKGYQLFGQCLTAVGWVGGTVPEPNEDFDGTGLIELNMADVMAGGIVVGSALMGKRPIYVVRYQGFQWFNAPIIANYAGKTKEIWDVPAPIFIRSIGMEGGIGPVASNSHHGIYFRSPGIKIASPMTPLEYESVYTEYMNGDDSIYVSEHRKSYENTEEFVDRYFPYPDYVFFPFSITRFEVDKAEKELRESNIFCDVFHQLWIKPFVIEQEWIDSLKKSRFGGIVFDDDYPNGIAKQIAYELMLVSGKPVHVMCIDERAAGFTPQTDNLPPSAEQIIRRVKMMYTETSRFLVE